MFSIGLLSLIINITSYIKHSSFPEHFLGIIKVFAKVYPLLTLFLYDMFANYRMFVFSIIIIIILIIIIIIIIIIFKERAQLALAVFSGTLKN